MLHPISHQVAEASVYECLGSGFEAARYSYRVPSDALVMTMRASQTLCSNHFTQRSAFGTLVPCGMASNPPQGKPAKASACATL